IWRVVFFEREDLPCGAMDPAPPLSVPPKILKSVGRHFGVPDRVLDVLVAEVVLQGPGVVAIVGEFEPAGVAKQVRVDPEWHLGGRGGGSGRKNRGEAAFRKCNEFNARLSQKLRMP